MKPDKRVPRFARRPPGRVTSQSVRAGETVPKGTLVAVSTVGRRIDQLGLVPIHWQRIAFADGRITLRGLTRYGDCLNFDHAQIGPDTGGVRLITVWARNYGIRKVNCERRPRALVVEPGSTGP